MSLHIYLDFRFDVLSKLANAVIREACISWQLKGMRATSGVTSFQLSVFLEYLRFYTGLASINLQCPL